MGVVKVRAHRGIMTEFKRLLGLKGISLDSELAHRVLATSAPVGDPMRVVVEQVRLHVLAEPRSLELRTAWERDHPDRSPFPPSFAQRVKDKVDEIAAVAREEDGDPSMLLIELALMCEAELEDDLWVPNSLIDPRGND